jgi:tetratricopeptide (TPR) repeat protein
VANAWDSLGFAHHHLGHHAEAQACYRRAIGLLHDVGKQYDEAAALARLGEVLCAAGDPTSARDAWQQALTILDDLDHPDAQQVRTKLATLATPTSDHERPVPESAR